MSKWSEIITAANENRHELVLNGQEISQRIEKEGLDKHLFGLTGLNFLNISETSLNIIPNEISKLVNLQSLLLHSNKLKTIPESINKLTKLKLLDVSRNEIEKIEINFNMLPQLISLNLSVNKLEEFPSLGSESKLTVLDLSHNNLESFPDICQATHLTEIKFNANKISDIPDNINVLTSLKLIDLSENKIKIIPAELSDCGKLKEVNLKSNPISDRRLLKLIDQCRTKQVLDYVRQHCVRKNPDGNEKGKSRGKKGKGQRKDSHNEENNDTACDGDHYRYKITICKEDDDSNIPVIKQTETVKTIRPYILCCVVKNLRFDQDSFRKFIQMQTRLHDSVCDKRTASTIATHDLDKILKHTQKTEVSIEGELKDMKLEMKNELIFDAKPPNELVLIPLGASKEVSGAALFQNLRAVAEQNRKDKKRNVYSGVHRYLYMLEGKPHYPCVLNTEGKVISFPPITNSELTRMSSESTQMLVEATSSTSQDSCRKALDQLLLELLSLNVTETSGTLTVHRVRVTDMQGNLRAVYPSRADLKYDDDTIKIVREEK